jgi:hypothetical protein
MVSSFYAEEQPVTLLTLKGHGMSRIPATTRSLAQHIAHGEWDTPLPRAFEITEERLSKAKRDNKNRWALNLGLDTLEDPALAPVPAEDPVDMKRGQ